MVVLVQRTNFHFEEYLYPIIYINTKFEVITFHITKSKWKEGNKNLIRTKITTTNVWDNKVKSKTVSSYRELLITKGES